MKEKKSWIIIVASCIVIGIIYAISSFLPEQEARVLLVGVVVSFVAVWMVIKMVNMFRLTKKVAGPTALLYEDKNPEKYIEEMEQVLSQVSQRQQKDLIRINISTAQIYNGECKKALELMDKIEVQGQPIINQVLYYTNQILANFLDDQMEQGKKLYEAQSELFEKYKNVSGISNNIVVITAMKQLSLGEYNKALEELAALEDVQVSTILSDIVDYCKYVALKKTNQLEESVAIWKELSNRKLVPVVRKKIVSE